MGIGAPELLILSVLGIIPLALSIWALVDVASYPDPVWAAAGKDRTTWLVLNVVGIFACAILPIIYLLTVRPELRRARRG